jgi:hypothetical protein
MVGMNELVMRKRIQIYAGPPACLIAAVILWASWSVPDVGSLLRQNLRETALPEGFRKGTIHPDFWSLIFEHTRRKESVSLSVPA